jgi:hypothetical protein
MLEFIAFSLFSFEVGCVCYRVGSSPSQSLVRGSSCGTITSTQDCRIPASALPCSLVELLCRTELPQSLAGCLCCRPSGWLHTSTRPWNSTTTEDIPPQRLRTNRIGTATHATDTSDGCPATAYLSARWPTAGKIATRQHIRTSEGSSRGAGVGGGGSNMSAQPTVRIAPRPQD